MSDILIAFQMMLMANGSTPIEERKELGLPFPNILKDISDYVNSPEYNQLIINEKETFNQNKT